MSPHPLIRRFAVLVLLGLLAAPAAASVEVIEAQGHLQHWVLYDSRHSPCVFARWTHEIADGTTFDITTSPYDPGCFDSVWTASCAAGGFLWTGVLTPAAEGTLWWWVYIESEITVLLEVTSPTRISALREVTGDISSGTHTVTLTLPDGTEDVLLGPDPGIGGAERLIGPGLHRLTMTVLADDDWYLPFSYSGLVAVTWEGSVETEAASWGGIKSLFR